MKPNKAMMGINRISPSMMLMIASLGFGTVSLGEVSGANIRIWEILLGMFILGATLKALGKGKIVLSNRMPLVLICPFILSILFSGLNAFDGNYWLKQSILLFLMLTLFVVVAQIHSASQLVRSLRWIIYPGIFIAGWGILESFLYPENLQFFHSEGLLLPRTRSFFAEANEFSNFLTLPFAFLFSALYFHQGVARWERWVYRFGLLVIIMAQIMSFSRGGLLAFFAVLFAGFVLLFIRGVRVAHYLWSAALSVLLLTLLVGLLYLIQPDMANIFSMLLERVRSLFSGSDETALIRLESISTAIAVASSSLPNFIAGIGFGNLPIILGEKIATSSNFLVDVFSETGFLGLISFIGIVIAVLFLPLKTLKILIRTRDNQLCAVFFGAYLSFIGLIFGGMSAANHMLNLFWFICGLLLALYKYGCGLQKDNIALKINREG